MAERYIVLAVVVRRCVLTWGTESRASSYSEAASSEHAVNYTIRTFITCNPLQHTRGKVCLCKVICRN